MWLLIWAVLVAPVLSWQLIEWRTSWPDAPFHQLDGLRAALAEHAASERLSVIYGDAHLADDLAVIFSTAPSVPRAVKRAMNKYGHSAVKKALRDAENNANEVNAELDGVDDCRTLGLGALRNWLATRGLRCHGCLEKKDFEALCEQNIGAQPMPNQQAFWESVQRAVAAQRPDDLDAEEEEDALSYFAVWAYPSAATTWLWLLTLASFYSRTCLPRRLYVHESDRSGKTHEAALCQTTLAWQNQYKTSTASYLPELFLRQDVSELPSVYTRSFCFMALVHVFFFNTAGVAGCILLDLIAAVVFVVRWCYRALRRRCGSDTTNETTASDAETLLDQVSYTLTCWGWQFDWDLPFVLNFRHALAAAPSTVVLQRLMLSLVDPRRGVGHGSKEKMATDVQVYSLVHAMANPMLMPTFRRIQANPKVPEAIRSRRDPIGLIELASYSSSWPCLSDPELAELARAAVQALAAPPRDSERWVYSPRTRFTSASRWLQHAIWLSVGLASEKEFALGVAATLILVGNMPSVTCWANYGLCAYLLDRCFLAVIALGGGVLLLAASMRARELETMPLFFQSTAEAPIKVLLLLLPGPLISLGYLKLTIEYAAVGYVWLLFLTNGHDSLLDLGYWFDNGLGFPPNTWILVYGLLGSFLLPRVDMIFSLAIWLLLTVVDVERALELLAWYACKFPLASPRHGMVLMTSYLRFSWGLLDIVSNNLLLAPLGVSSYPPTTDPCRGLFLPRRRCVLVDGLGRRREMGPIGGDAEPSCKSESRQPAALRARYPPPWPAALVDGRLVVDR